MRHKNLITRLVPLGLLLLTVVSCTKILDRSPQDAITDFNYWNTPEDLKLFCNNFYPSLYTPDQFADEQSDNCVPNSPDNWLYGFATVPDNGGGWSNADWSNIRNANYFLSHYQSVKGEQAEINQYLGEIYFFRAYEYFNKAKRFGDVPWINKNLNVNDTSYLYSPRISRKIIVDSILADLGRAISDLKTPDQLEAGRIHKYAALQFMARVCLYEGTWMKYRNISGWEPYLKKAVTAAQKVMTEGGYVIVKASTQLHYKSGDLIDSKTNTYASQDYPLHYKQQFIQEDLTNNPECVLPKIYKLDVLMHGTSRSVNESGVGVSKDFIESFLCVDGLPISLSPLYKGDSTATSEFRNRDPRLRNMIDNRFLPNYMNGTSLTSNYLTPVNSSVPTGYMASKFRSPVPEQNEANHSTYDKYVFRYAEVLLIYAEAKAELGTMTQADLDKTINQLRGRFDGPDMPNGKMGRLTLNPPVDPNSITITGEPRYGYSVSPLIYEIRRERRIELAFEGFRWDDIVRWNAGKLLENPKTVYGIVVNQKVENNYDNYYNSNVFSGINIQTINDWDGKTKRIVSPYTIPMRKWNDKLYLHPIPTEQITLSQGKLKQNPGW